MTDQPVMQKTLCPVCKTDSFDMELYRATINSESFTPQIFSARRSPDRIHYRMVRCRQCSLLRANPVTSPDYVNRLYQRSTFDYSDEVGNICKTYGYYLSKALTLASNAESLCEIGCGNGFFLKKAKEMGLKSVVGVEPSADAVAQADDSVRSCIVNDILRPGLFQADEFDVVCLFQVLDHLYDPISVLSEVRRIMRPDGVLLLMQHNEQAFSASVLKERSPIVDVEHPFLYSPKTLGRLLRVCGFNTVGSGAAFNYYSLAYLLHLLPVAKRYRGRMDQWIERIKRGHNVNLRLYLGNMYIMAKRGEL